METFKLKWFTLTSAVNHIEKECYPINQTSISFLFLPVFDFYANSFAFTPFLFSFSSQPLLNALSLHPIHSPPSCPLPLFLSAFPFFLSLFFSFSPIDSSDSDLELSTVRHQPEGLEQLQAQTKFTKKELQSLYRGFKNVSVCEGEGENKG